MASVIRGSGASTLGGNVDVQGVLTYEDVTSVDSVGIVTANAGIDISNTIVSNNDSTIRYDDTDFVINVDSNNVRGSSKFKINVDTVTGLVIDDNRRVGIGTSVPDELLEVGNGTVSGALKVSGQSSSVTSDGFTIDWESSTNSTRLFSEPSDSGSSQYKIYTTNSGTRAEALRIESDGDFHIPWADKRLIVNFSNDYRQGIHFDVNNRNLKLFSTSGSGGGGGDITFFTRQSSSSGDTDYGTEKLRLTKDGKLILSMTQRTTPHSVQGDGAMFVEQNYGGNLYGLVLRNKDTTADAATSIGFSLNRNSSDYDFVSGEIKSIKEQNWTVDDNTIDSALVFSTTANNSLEERLRIDANGAVLGPEKYSGTYTASSNLDITGFGYGNYLVNVRSGGTYHWNGVLLVTMFDTADFGVATLVSGNYGTTITTSMVNLSAGSGTLRLVFNRDFGIITVRVLKIG